MKKIAVLLLCIAAVLMCQPAQAQKNPWINADQVQWGDVGANGPGTSTKILLTKENGFIDDLFRACWLVKVDPGGQFTVTSLPKEDQAFFITKGTGKLTLGDEQIDTKPGDAYGVPAGVKFGLANPGTEPVEALVFSGPLVAPNPTAKPIKGRADDMKWEPNATHGPGCDLKMLLGGGFSSTIRGLWIMRGNPGSVNVVHSGAEHQLFYIWTGPEPSKTPRDSRTEGVRVIVRDKAMQGRVGDAIYVAGAPRIDEHGFINESTKEPFVYVAIGVRIPGQGGGGRGGPGGARGGGQRGGAGQRPPQ